MPAATSGVSVVSRPTFAPPPTQAQERLGQPSPVLMGAFPTVAHTSSRAVHQPHIGTSPYYEGSNFDRSCLYQDILQVDTSLTHLHFAFGTLDANDYTVSVGDSLSAYEFENLKRLSGPLRILTIGGWDFSTGTNTYNIFRDGVTAANRLAMATSIANFINDKGLDGVDIDWEYPGVCMIEMILKRRRNGRSMLTSPRHQIFRVFHPPTKMTAQTTWTSWYF